ncbi:MAG TPA: hypothetical protein VFZ33_04920 [Chitinophagaceae bacterium]
MGYTLFAFVGKEPELRTVAGKFKNAKVIMLDHGIGIIPMSGDLYDEMNNFESADEVENFIYLNSNIQNKILELVSTGTIGYIEADYSGGHGEQAGIIYKDGVRDSFSSNRLGAINSVLRRLGVKPSTGQDEFETIGLNKNRSVDDWLAM